MVTSCLIGGQDFLQQVKCGWCARWLLAVLDLVAALRWAFLVPQVSLVINSSLLLSVSRLVPVRYENGPSNYVKVIRIIVKKTIAGRRRPSTWKAPNRPCRLLICHKVELEWQ